MRSQTRDSGADREGEKGNRFFLLLFNPANQVLLQRSHSGDHRVWTVSMTGQAEPGESLPQSLSRAASGAFAPVPMFDVEVPEGNAARVCFGLIGDDQAATIEPSGETAFFSIEEIRRGLAATPDAFSPEIPAIIEGIDPYVVRIPYLEKTEHDYIYRFRPEKQRNRGVYHIDERSIALYQSALCRAIKEVKRINERSSTSPAVLDFGAISYVLPSHFGFCLGVQNAIERAYENVAENPDRRIFMLSELIHNPFVNDDLRARGLRYLQTDKGESLKDEKTGADLWDTLTKDDIVMIPAFGATDEDKARLIEKGIPINRYDATCMLVEKVWKAAQRFGREGYTVIIHGKAEHEETKATFSNAARHGAALIVRNQEEAERLGSVITADNPEEKGRLFKAFAGRHTAGLDPARDLERLAVVNQTTLLRNETLRIITYLEEVIGGKYGRENIGLHLNGNSKGDTLCYATQVNQDALQKALSMDLDVALVAGGKNSSNTYQLFRLCEKCLGERAFYIQSEQNILSATEILHYRFPDGSTLAPRNDTEVRPFLSGVKNRPVRILLTGGASCPDGIIQQVITRLNTLFPADSIRPMSEVLADLERI